MYVYYIYIYIYIYIFIYIYLYFLDIYIFVYLRGIVFVSLQACMGETNYCLYKFDCLTLPNPWFGRGGVYQSQNLTLPFPFFYNFIVGKDSVKFISNFPQNIFAKVSFPLLNLDLDIIACFWNSLFLYTIAGKYLVMFLKNL